MACKCKRCIEMKKFFAIIGKLSEEDQKWMTSLYEYVDGQRLDAEVDRAILDGRWPSAIECLECSLQKAKQIIEDQEQYKWFQQECDLWQQ